MRVLSSGFLRTLNKVIQKTGILWAVTVLSCISTVTAQSGNIDSPTPVYTREIKERILPRDIGDTRLTRHFYSFQGGPGDLEISVESKNLNGDVDIFASNGLRPLAKLSLFDTGSSTTVSKSVYIKTQEPLILRVEARTSGDEEGSYTINFSGSFTASTQPLSDVNKEQQDALLAETQSRSDGRTYKVNAAGARIIEPAPVIPSATEIVASVEIPTSSPIETTEKHEISILKADPPSPQKITPKQRESDQQKSPTTQAVNETASEPESSQPPTTPITESSDIAKTSPAPEVSTPSIQSSPPTPSPPTAKAEPIGPEAKQTKRSESLPAQNTTDQSRLIIEKRDGTKEEFFMRDIRRVTVEKGYLLVIRKNGTSQSYSMIGILRMAIEP
jgi:hypothetical protein